tara:strand:- start:748 stop:1863 length:1116 start_codon:yes stop_codon:yes gene_type:complete
MSSKKNCGCGQDPCKTYGAEKLHPGLYRYKGKIGLRKGWTECQECDDLVKLNDINWYYLKGYGQATVCDSCVGKYNYKKDRLSKGHRHGELAILQFMEQDKKGAEELFPPYAYDYSDEVKARVLNKILLWHENMQLQSDEIADRMDRILWMLDNPDKFWEDWDLHAKDMGYEGYDAETFEAKSHTDGDGFTWKLVSQEYAKKNWKNEEIYWLDTSYDTESLIDESNYEIYTHPDFANELFGIDDLHERYYDESIENFEATTGYGYDDLPERMTDEEAWLELHERYEDDEEWGQMTLEEFKKAFIEQTEKDDEIQRKYEQRLKDEGRDMDGNPIKGAEYHRDSKGRFAEKPVLTGSVIGGIALGLIYFWKGK